MTKRRFILLALLAGVAAFLAAGCGGDNKSSSSGTTTEAAAAKVTGSISVLAVWTGAEGEAFQAVLDGFTAKNPGVKVSYKSAKEPATVLSTAVEGGNPPDIAALPQPGFMTDFAQRGALKPIDFATDKIKEGYSQSWLDLGTVDGKLYGLFFKGANKSTVWYNVAAYTDAGVEPATTWEDFLKNGDTLKASGVTPYSIGAADGWTLTDLFENIYLRTAGPEKYDQLTKHEIPWTDASVKEALTEMGKILASDNVAGGTSSALQTDFPTSVTQVFADPPKAAQVLEGDFVGGVITSETQAKTPDDFNVFAFPEIGDSGKVVVGGGDVMVMFKDNPAAKALIEYLATPEAAEIWAKKGGFSSPNKNVDAAVYPDALTKQTATELANAAVFRFDMSDLMPGAFGSDALFTLLQDFAKAPDDVDGITQKLEKAAATAFKSS
ncbi:MAG: alpha-glucoside transport system substrate-binding protein [Gaiellaceae bacterium]|jgi:ABC-type glycerol-3-phosphate transport system substrate-binding protein|nr:alpha-glucoside transport system substrate-binding protein [Gaiellaceae bacterium]